MTMRMLLAFALCLLATPVLAQATVTTVYTTAPASGLVMSPNPNISSYGFEVVAGPTAGIVMLIDSASIPADGAASPIQCYTVNAGQTITIAYQPVSVAMTNGATVVFGTDNGTLTRCFNLTKQNAAFIAGAAR